MKNLALSVGPTLNTYPRVMCIWGKALKGGWGLEGGKEKETKCLMVRSEVVSY